jgi:hypothetical protein
MSGTMKIEVILGALFASGAVVYWFRLMGVQGLLKNIDVKEKVLNVVKSISKNKGLLEHEAAIQKDLQNAIDNNKKNNKPVSDSELVDFFKNR